MERFESFHASGNNLSARRQIVEMPAGAVSMFLLLSPHH
jgi:hypothetical protein